MVLPPASTGRGSQGLWGTPECQKGSTYLPLRLDAGGKWLYKELSEGVLLGGRHSFGEGCFEGKGESCCPVLPFAGGTKVRGKRRGQW